MCHTNLLYSLPTRAGGVKPAWITIMAVTGTLSAAALVLGCKIMQANNLHVQDGCPLKMYSNGTFPIEAAWNFLIQPRSTRTTLINTQKPVHLPQSFLTALKWCIHSLFSPQTACQNCQENTMVISTHRKEKYMKGNHISNTCHRQKKSVQQQQYWVSSASKEK